MNETPKRAPGLQRTPQRAPSGQSTPSLARPPRPQRPAPPGSSRLPGNPGTLNPGNRLGGSAHAPARGRCETSLSRGARGAPLKAGGWGSAAKLHLPLSQLLPRNRRLVLAHTTTPGTTPQLEGGRQSRSEPLRRLAGTGGQRPEVTHECERRIQAGLLLPWRRSTSPASRVRQHP